MSIPNISKKIIKERNEKISNLKVGSDISGEDFTGIQLIKPVRLLSNINAEGSNFSFSTMINVYFQGITYIDQSENIPASNFNNSIFHGAKLININFQGCNMNNVDFSEAILDGINFKDAKLQNANFRNIKTFRFIDCNNADLTNADFEGLDLKQLLEDGHLMINDNTITNNDIIKSYQKKENERNDYESRRITSKELLKELTNERECPVCLSKFIKKDKNGIDKTDVVLLHKNKEKKYAKPHIIHSSEFIQLKFIPGKPGWIVCPECREEIPRPSEYIEDIPLLDKNLDKEILDTFKSTEERSEKRSRSQEELDEESEGSQESLLKFSKSGEPTQFQFAQNPWDSESPPSYFSLHDNPNPTSSQSNSDVSHGGKRRKTKRKMQRINKKTKKSVLKKVKKCSKKSNNKCNNKCSKKCSKKSRNTRKL